MKPRLLLIGRTDFMGLGSMTIDLIRAMKPGIVIALTKYGNSPEWEQNDFSETGSTILYNPLKKDCLRRLFTFLIERDALDVAIGLETFYSPEVYELLRIAGKNSVLVPMWEVTRNYDYEKCDAAIAVTDRDWGSLNIEHVLRIDWPQAAVAHRHSWPPTRFLHIAGNATHGRNNTTAVIDAFRHLQDTPANLRIAASFSIEKMLNSSDTNIQSIGYAPTREMLYQHIDAVIHPMAFEGLSLPILECQARRIPVVVPDFPQYKGFPLRVRMIESGGSPIWRAKAFTPDARALEQTLMAMVKGDTLAHPPQPSNWTTFSHRLYDFLERIA